MATAAVGDNGQWQRPWGDGNGDGGNGHGGDGGNGGNGHGGTATTTVEGRGHDHHAGHKGAYIDLERAGLGHRTAWNERR